MEAGLTLRLRPLPRTSALDRPAPRHDIALPLAGSAWVWAEEVDVVEGRRTREELLTTDLDPVQRDRLSRPRPALCGLTLDRPRIMGILNVTPDSFSDGGVLADRATAVTAGIAMARQADLLDIGGESTRPGALPVSPDAEIARTVPVIAELRAAGITTPISIDTRNAVVARAALAEGADMVNDVSALTHDPDMAALVAEAGVPVCLMHAQGDPQTMQDNPRYDDVVAEVLDWLDARVAAATAAGIARARIVIDPGIGFGKTLDHNLALLRWLSVFHDTGLPVLLGASRKRFIGTITGVETAGERLAGSLAVALHGARQGAHVLRVHDVAQTRQALDMWQALNAPDSGQEA
ncbi:MAG: dihydropteroate synthase [Rhodobacteraceae bacterium]|nr:dihydropteroate synthase [Paracoccaceae bacterium]